MSQIKPINLPPNIPNFSTQRYAGTPNYNVTYNNSFQSAQPVITTQNTTNSLVPVAPAIAPAPSVNSQMRQVNQYVHVPEVSEKVEKTSFTDKILKYSGLIALLLAPVAAYLTHKYIPMPNSKVTVKPLVNGDDVSKIIKLNQQIIEQNQKLTEQVSAITQASLKQTERAAKVNNNAIMLALASIGGGAAAASISSKISAGVEPTDAEKQQLAVEVKDTINGLRYNIDNIQQSGGSALNEKYLKNVYGLDLLSQVGQQVNREKYSEALKEIRKAAPDYLKGVPMKSLSPNSTVWSVTAEFAPIKEGGLGSVPPEIQNNFAKLGIKCPAILPMYEISGTTDFHASQTDPNDYRYSYGNTTFNLKRAAEYKINVTRKGQPIKCDQTIEVYVSTSKKINDGPVIETQPLVFLRIASGPNNYFKSKGLYSPDGFQETERFAFFDKAVYALLKGVLDTSKKRGGTELHIFDKDAFNKIGKPDALLLNDWHAGALAALARYKAPCEYASNILNKEVKDKIADMNMLIICHNAQHQGSTKNGNDDKERKEVSENILNTLFGDYTADIVENAMSGAPYAGIQNVLVLDHDIGKSCVNLLNMGICLSNIDAPVSKTYAKELEDIPKHSECLQWAIQQKAASSSNTHIGITNGNDYKNINQEVSAHKVKDATGIDFKTYNRDDSLDAILYARKENKKDFYNNYIRKFVEVTSNLDSLDAELTELKAKIDQGEAKGDSANVAELKKQYAKCKELYDNYSAINDKYFIKMENAGKTTPPKLSDEELEKTPILVSSGRLVDQKGIDILCDSLIKVFKDWPKNHKGSPKPIVYISGQDGEDGAQREIIDKKFKEAKLGKDANRIVFYHGYAPCPAYMMAADFFLMPSKFEPCGLTQGEALAQGTPVIASAVGGLVDTIVSEGDEQYGILTKENEATVDGFAEAIEEGLNIFFENKEKYSNMVQNAIHFDQSWAQPGRKGAIYEYTNALGFDNDQLDDIASLQD